MIKGHYIAPLENGVVVHKDFEPLPYIGLAHDTHEYRQLTLDLGYADEDIVRQAREHDILHVAVCQLIGLDTSYTLKACTDEHHFGSSPPDPKLAFLEEEAVYAIQRLANAHGINLWDLITKKD